MVDEHYYSKNPNSQSRPFQFQAKILGQELTFWCDAGVFSRGKLDRGTRLLLESIELGEAKQVLDLGAGYGAIGIALAKANPELVVYMSDPNARAVELAKKNCQVNRVKAKVLEGAGFEPFEGERFDLIVSNPPIRAGKKVIYGLFATAREFLTEDGSLMIVIRTGQGAKSAQNELERLYPQVREVAKGGGFRVYEAKL